MERLEQLFMNSTNPNKVSYLKAYVSIYKECMDKKLELMETQARYRTIDINHYQRLLLQRAELELEICNARLQDMIKQIY